jgi:hypothetical protein
MTTLIKPSQYRHPQWHQFAEIKRDTKIYLSKSREGNFFQNFCEKKTFFSKTTQKAIFISLGGGVNYPFLIPFI